MPAPKRGLGKGLSALIPIKPVKILLASHPEGLERFLKVSEIKPNRFQPRRNIKDESLAELAESIREKGVIEPVIVRRSGSGYELIAGERRLRAVQRLGLPEIPAIIRQATDQEALEIALIENLHRENLNPIEESRGYERLVREFSLTQEAVSKKVGKERSTVTNSLRLLTLPAEVQKLLEDDKLTAGHARAILMVSDKRKQLSLAQTIVSKGLSVREAESLARVGAAKRTTEAGPAKSKNLDQHLSNIQNEMQRALGTKVKIKPTGKTKGKIEIEYFTIDDFERIINTLNIKIT
ncbi:ParB/RepB/Spo0J family partition protein [candidate division TA06 bacterium]|uniref:ParB/RepB/Spo0J family partition protein n=1 Tax=candidate division TA06 bacterium TaxID=2250710 RepID=A0A933IB57_UNCT6|nr:ParB/RepB/Spo0J family partition protein [candidate division TA06 bacterium]